MALGLSFTATTAKPSIHQFLWNMLTATFQPATMANHTMVGSSFLSTGYIQFTTFFSIASVSSWEHKKGLYPFYTLLVHAG
ncbi:MAG: hypothetical protein V8Q76_05820 [Bacteroides intestinalis]